MCQRNFPLVLDLCNIGRREGGFNTLLLMIDKQNLGVLKLEFGASLKAMPTQEIYRA
jgi:hypothetical protein